MKLMLVTLVAVLMFTAGAQYNDLGITINEDEFEGTTSCFQIVTMPNHPDSLTLFPLHVDDGPTVLSIVRRDLDGDEMVFNMSGTLGTDEILFRFANEEVVRFTVFDTNAEMGDDLNWQERATVAADPSFLQRLFTSDEDVRFRLSPADGTNFDDTLPAGFLNEFGEFLEECL